MIRALVSMEVDAELWVVVPDTTVSVAGAGLDKTVKLNRVSVVYQVSLVDSIKKIENIESLLGFLRIMHVPDYHAVPIIMTLQFHLLCLPMCGIMSFFFFRK